MQPRVEKWPAGQAIVRVHSSRFAPVSFNPGRGDQTRFAPIWTVRDETIPTLYGASTVESAFSETIFHEVGAPGSGAPRMLSSVELRGKVLSYVLPLRDLPLACMHGVDLQGLGIAHEDLVHSSSSDYLWTAAWAEAIYDIDRSPAPPFDGLIWFSRQVGDTAALTLWGSRVAESHLAPQLDRTAISLESGPGRALVDDVAARAGIQIY